MANSSFTDEEENHEASSKPLVGPKFAKDRQAKKNSGTDSNKFFKTKCCYVCLEESVNELNPIGNKLTKLLQTFDLYVVENDVTPAYFCDPCRTDIANSCELLTRIREARTFWKTFSEKMGVTVKSLGPTKARRQLARSEQAGQGLKKAQLVAVPIYHRCQMCLEKFINQIGLSVHQWDFHLKNKDRPECCPACNREFSDSDHCRRHYYNNHVDNQFVCDICGKGNMSKSQMRFHLKAYHDTNLRASGFAKGHSKPTHVLLDSPTHSADAVSKVEGSQEYNMNDEDYDHFANSGFDLPGDSDTEEPVPKKAKITSSMNGIDDKKDSKCRDCDKTFGPDDTEATYHRHYWIKHGRQDDMPQVCRECGKEFAVEDLCRRHYIASHFNENLSCNLCFKTDMSTIQYRYHIRYCSKKHQALAKVDKPETVDVKAKCSYCDEKFPGGDKRKLFNHIWESHVINAESPSVCSICQKDCGLVNNCRAHFFNIHYDKNYACRACGTGGFTKTELKDHRYTVHKDRVEKYRQRREGTVTIQTQKCEFCGEDFRITTDEWTKHVWNTHGRNNDAPEQCKECHKTLSNEFFAKQHFFSHHYRKVEICDECGKGNMTRNELIKHLKNHDLARSKKKHQCPLCSRALNSEESLQRHLVFHQNQKSERTHPCAFCGLHYPNPSSLGLHMRSVHLKKVTHPCRFCEKGFYTHSTRKAHEIAIHTKLYPFKCSFCGLETAQIARLRRHVECQHLKAPAPKDEIDTKYIIRQHGAEESVYYKKKLKNVQTQEGEDESD